MNDNTLKDVLTKPEDYTLSDYQRAVQINESRDDQLCKTVYNLLLLTFSISRGKGKFGWWSEDICSNNDLQAKLVQAVLDKRYLRALAYCSMLLVRQQTKSELT